MKYKFITCCCIVLSMYFTGYSQTKYPVKNNVRNNSIVKIIPEPSTITIGESHYILPGNINIYLEENFYEAIEDVELLQSLLSKELGASVNIVFDKHELIGNNVPHIVVVKDSLSTNSEEYVLEINKNGVTLSAATPTGVFYAVQSFYQLIFANKTSTNNGIELPYISIHDKPRYPFRALMLDPARYFLPIQELERYIDAMALYKFNRLHLHLTDDHGWRVEIKSLPQLTQKGSTRKETHGDKKVHKGFYTQEQLKYIVKYAADKHIEIIPEIDIPGHSVAALAAFPQLSCNQKLLEVATVPGVSKELLCAGNQQVYNFYEVIIEELAPIFPSKYFHIGGDEAPLDNWKKCPRCKRTIKNKELKDDHELMSYFFQQINAILVKNGKEPMFWYELDVPTYPANSTMYLWRLNTTKEVIEKVSKAGYKLICAPGEHAYFDYPQWKGDIPNVNWMPTINLKQTYEFEPTNNMPDSQTDCIIGVEACIWGEYVPNIDRALYMTWPRALAMSEAGWTEKQNRSWDNFKDKLDLHLDLLLKNGISYRAPFELHMNQ